MGYSEALEQQAKLLRFMTEGNGRAFMRMIVHGVDGPYAEKVRNNQVDPNKLPSVVWENKTINSLYRGETFYWSKTMSEVTQVAARTMPAWTLTPEMLPSPYGFFWLDHDLDIPDHRKETTGVLKAICWSVFYRDENDGAQLIPVPGTNTNPTTSGIAITTWARVADSTGLVPFHDIDWLYGDSPMQCGERYQSKTSISKAAMTTLLATMFAFMGQRIFVAPTQRAERHAVKRLERNGWTHEPLIRIVELRRKDVRQASKYDDPANVAWSCQWVVSGHWHNYWVGPKDKPLLQPRWLMPFIKGPSDRPLKPPRAKVFAVVR